MLAGVSVGLGVATGGKDQTPIAATGLDPLCAPLASDWLARVGRSTHGAPPRTASVEGFPSSAADWAALVAQALFQALG